VPDVRAEKTGWRDQRLSERHRRWGWNCPAVDLDFLMLEYDQGKAVAIVEYKNEHARPQYPTHPTYRALIDLGNRAAIPVFGVRYADDWSWWRVTPLNDRARKWAPQQTRMTEEQWITLLYRLRGTDVPPDFFTHKDLEI
jgi:hypothetical protein